MIERQKKHHTRMYDVMHAKNTSPSRVTVGGMYGVYACAMEMCVAGGALESVFVERLVRLLVGFCAMLQEKERTRTKR